MPDLTRVQWAALIVQLMERGATPTTQQVADLGGRSLRSARRLMCSLSERYQIYLDDWETEPAVWRICGVTEKAPN